MIKRILLAGLWVGSLAHADFIDSLDTTDNFFNSFGGTYATNNLDGTVTLIRGQANQDAGIDWRNGDQNLDLNTEFQLTIVPTAAYNGGYWSANILFFYNGSFVAEKTWIPDTNLTDPQTTNVAQFADNTGVGAANATDYYVRLRVQPFDDQDVGFAFSDIGVVPEPSSLALLVLGGTAWWARKARTRI